MSAPANPPVAEENQKKIISSKLYNSRNGKFRILCVAINDKLEYESLKKLILSKKEVTEGLLGVTVVRVTDDDDPSEMHEFSEEATGFETLSERLMFVLRKFKVENVIVSVCLYEYDLIKATMDNNFDNVTKRLKEFVLELYSSMFEVSGRMDTENYLVDGKNKKNWLDFETMKHFDILLPAKRVQKEKEKRKLSKMTLILPEPKKDKQERPNYVFAGKFKPPPIEKPKDP
jgi:hypothetical protein